MNTIDARARTLDREGVAYYEANRFRNTLRRRFIAAREDRIVTRLLSRLSAGSVVLDAPAGYGRMRPAILRNGLVPWHVDLSLAMLQRLREAHGGRDAVIALQGDAARLPLPDGAVDCIVCCRLFHHFDAADTRRRFLEEFARVTRRFAVVSFYTPGNVRSWKRRIAGRKPRGYPIPPRIFRAEAAAAGFRVISLSAVVPLLEANHFALLEKTGVTG